MTTAGEMMDLKVKLADRVAAQVAALVTGRG